MLRDVKGILYKGFLKIKVRIYIPPSIVRFWVRVELGLGLGGQFSSGAIVLEPYEPYMLKFLENCITCFHSHIKRTQIEQLIRFLRVTTYGIWYFIVRQCHAFHETKLFGKLSLLFPIKLKQMAYCNFILTHYTNFPFIL